MSLGLRTKTVVIKNPILISRKFFFSSRRRRTRLIPCLCLSHKAGSVPHKLNFRELHNAQTTPATQAYHAQHTSIEYRDVKRRCGKQLVTSAFFDNHRLAFNGLITTRLCLRVNFSSFRKYPGIPDADVPMEKIAHPLPEAGECSIGRQPGVPGKRFLLSLIIQVAECQQQPETRGLEYVYIIVVVRTLSVVVSRCVAVPVAHRNPLR